MVVEEKERGAQTEMTSRRSQSMDASGIRKVFDLAGEIKDPVNLSIGAPDFDVPPPVRKRLIEAVEAGHNRYTPTQGLEELRRSVQTKYRERTGVDFEDIMITAGVSGGLMLAFAALLDPGDEVVFADPYFVGYPQIARLFNAVPVPVDTYPDFEFTPERLEPAMGPKTRIILLNSPANPTGNVLTEASLKGIAEIARKHNAVIISDEIYDAYIYEGSPLTAARYYENTVVLNGFSKSHSMTGWRIGYALGPENIITEMKKIQQFTFVHAPSIAQHAALCALDTGTEAFHRRYRENRNMVCRGLADKFSFVQPQGSFYIFPQAPGNSGMAFVKQAIEEDLLIIPGNVFSLRDTHFRIACAADRQTLTRGIEILNRLADKTL